MFGYVRACKPEMKIKDYELYKGVYCSVCKRLGGAYGPLAQLSLNYDITFLAVLRMAVSKSCPVFEKSVCSYNPFKKCSTCQKKNKEIEYAVDCAIIMLYYKVKDNIADSVFYKKILFYILLLFVSCMHSKAKKRLPEIEKIVRKSILEQMRIEKSGSNLLDEAAHPTADAFSKILSYDFEGDEKIILERMGYLVGRWVYIIDAADDLFEDQKSNSFNPLIQMLGESENTENSIKKLKENLNGVLNLTVDECLKAFELLEIQRFKDILINILYLGLESTENKVFADEGWCKHEKSI